MYEVVLIDADLELHGMVDKIYDDFDEAAHISAILNHKQELDTDNIW